MWSYVLCIGLYLNVPKPASKLQTDFIIFFTIIKTKHQDAVLLSTYPYLQFQCVIY